ncbi:FAD-binding protein [Aeromicrobium sp. CF3.5]|uniref:FAD-binding protein n=1 Tax=Aeromicrobium sp. CF3.5 TaxID=3373078 RepID=UPI003EE76CB8
MGEQQVGEQNWSQNVTYHAAEQVHPSDLGELQDVVARHDRVKALGSRHTFNEIADTDGVHVILDRMPRHLEVDAERHLVTSSAGLTHSELSLALDGHDLALPNLASLPHISVAGAIQTGTHGSGSRNAALSANVVALEVVDATGELRPVEEADADFDAVVVGLGAFGIVHRVTQRCVPAFEVSQTVHENLRWAALLPRLEEVMSSAYSVSLFTRYDSDEVRQVWVKELIGEPAVLDLRELGATAAISTVHPLPETASDNVNDQLGSIGRSHDRLPHFRHGFKPGRGDEIQSEYLIDVENATAAIEAMRSLGPRIEPLLHVAEIRRVAPDRAWLSPAGGRDSLALHFTWRRLPDEVAAVLPVIEEPLLALGARPHWGKAFAADRAALRAAYPQFDAFVDVVDRWDPTGTFDNAFLQRVLGRG